MPTKRYWINRFKERAKEGRKITCYACRKILKKKFTFVLLGTSVFTFCMDCDYLHQTLYRLNISGGKTQVRRVFNFVSERSSYYKDLGRAIVNLED